MAGTPQRETAVQCERVDRHGSALRYLVQTARLVVVDGEVTAEEERTLDAAIARVERTFRPVEVGSDRIDNGARLVQLLAGTMALTPWAERQIREIAEDRAWTVIEGGLEDGEDDPRAA